MEVETEGGVLVLNISEVIREKLQLGIIILKIRIISHKDHEDLSN